LRPRQPRQAERLRAESPQQISIIPGAPTKIVRSNLSSTRTMSLPGSPRLLFITPPRTFKLERLQNKEALRQFPRLAGIERRARFSYDDLLKLFSFYESRTPVSF
jgi:hypothetical protein